MELTPYIVAIFPYIGIVSLGISFWALIGGIIDVIRS